jgi:hypothetical protein
MRMLSDWMISYAGIRTQIRCLIIDMGASLIVVFNGMRLLRITGSHACTPLYDSSTHNAMALLTMDDREKTIRKKPLQAIGSPKQNFFRQSSFDACLRSLQEEER